MNLATVLEVQVYTSGSSSVLTAMNFNTTGTNNVSNIENAKLYYYNAGSFNTVLTNATQVGSTVNTPSGTFSFTGMNVSLSTGTNKFYLVYDLPYTAVVGDSVDAECTGLTVDASGETPNTTAPAGARVIVDNATYTYCAYPAINPQNYQIGISRLEIGSTVISNIIATAGNVQTIASPVIDLEKDFEYEFNYNGGTGNNQNERIFIDLNNDGFFEVSETVFSGVTPASTRTSGSLYTDCSLENGIHRVRIATDLNGLTPQPCGQNYYGTAFEVLVNFKDADQPVADFTVLDTVYTGAFVDMTNTSSGLGYHYDWDYQNNASVDDTTINGRFQYSSAGTQTIKLAMSRTICGTPKSASTTKSVVVINPSAVPASEFIANRNITNQTLIVSFKDLSSNGANKWHWKITPELVNGSPAYIYANGTDSTSQNPEVLFYELGKYNVEFYSENVLGAGNYITKADYISNIAIIDFCSMNSTTSEAGFIADEGGVFANYPNSSNRQCSFLIEPACASTITYNFLSFDMSSYQVTGCFIPGSNPQVLQPSDNVKIYDGKDNTGTPLHVLAGFPNGFTNGPSNSPLPQLPPSVTATSGSMYIEYFVNCAFNGAGFLGEWSSTPKALPIPVAAFSGPDTAYTGAPEIFTNNSTGDYDESLWDYNNDGLNDFAGEDAEITFATAGTQTVKLTVARCGNASDFTKDVVVLNPSSAPIVDFSATKTDIIVLDTIRLFDESKEGPNSWKWTITPAANAEFVNGSTSTSRNPFVQFTKTGTYTIKLWASNSLGADSLVKTSYVGVYAYCTPNVINLSNDIGMSYVDFGDIKKSSDVGVSGYSNYNDVTSVQLGATYPITIERSSNFNNVNYKVWMDFNKNGTFTDPGELVFDQGAFSGTQTSGMIRIPKTASVGIIRMRVGASSENNSNLSCGPNQFGEFEDYKIIVNEDDTKPVITLNGSTPFFMERGYTFVDPMAVALDNADGDISANIITNTNLNTSVEGEYWVSYNVTDSSGNKADSVTRTVIVEKDNSGPVISFTGGDTIYLPVNTAWADPGYSANDFVDGVITSINVSGSVNSSTLGTYYLTYSAQDLQGNPSTRERVVVVVDNQAPQLALIGADPLTLNYGEPFPDPGVSITDNYYTQLTYTTTGVINSKVMGSYLITYDCVDPSGNVANSITRTVEVKDVAAPVITLFGADTIILDVFTKYVDGGASVNDNHTKGLLPSVSGVVNTNIVGDYTLTYSATDSSGNVGTTTRVVSVVDREAPVIVLKGSSLIKIDRFQSVPNPGVEILDNYESDADLQPSLVIDNQVITHMEGLYQYCYNVTDASGNKAAEVCRLVQVGPANPNGVAGISETGIKVYPNPNRGSFNLDLSSSEGVEGIKIYNAQGAMVKEIALNPNATLYSINLDNNAPGMYYVSVRINGVYYSTKVNVLQ